MLTKNLSPQQIEAVNAIDEDVEIIACAGAGKTGVVTRRIVNILKSKSEVSPENIVAFTFTKKAAEELKKCKSQDRICVHFSLDFYILVDIMTKAVVGELCQISAFTQFEIKTGSAKKFL